MLASVETVEVRLNGERGPASGRFTREELIGGLLMMLKANENSEAILCSTDADSRECKEEMLSWFVQGGPIPGVASFKKPYLTQVALDKETSQIKLVMDATVRWIGTPVFCQDFYTEITVFSTEQILIEAKTACTWTAFPMVSIMKYAVNFIDFDNSIIAGNYSVSVGGLLVFGGGSGTFMMRFARKDTLVAQAAEEAVEDIVEDTAEETAEDTAEKTTEETVKEVEETAADTAAETAEKAAEEKVEETAKKATLISVGQLPSQILAAPVPTQEEVKKSKSKGEIEPAEQALWESVSKKDTADGYREYLSRYAEGRFADVAKTNLRVIEEREAQNRELAFWSKIKESTDPNDFESYTAKYPKGLFVDLASARAQQLRASATEAAAMDAELALWNQVKEEHGCK